MILSRRFGFSLLELIIATAIIATGVLIAVLVFIGLLNTTAKSGATASGTMVGSSMLTEEIYNVLDNTNAQVTKANFFANDSPPQAPIQGTVDLNGTLFTYNINYQTLRDPGTGNPIGVGLGNNRVKKCDVVVWWWTDLANNARLGSGYMRARLSRLVNENAPL